MGPPRFLSPALPIRPRLLSGCWPRGAFCWLCAVFFGFCTACCERNIDSWFSPYQKMERRLKRRSILFRPVFGGFAILLSVLHMIAAPKHQFLRSQAAGEFRRLHHQARHDHQLFLEHLPQGIGRNLAAAHTFYAEFHPRPVVKTGIHRAGAQNADADVAALPAKLFVNRLGQLDIRGPAKNAAEEATFKR